MKRLTFTVQLDIQDDAEELDLMEYEEIAEYILRWGWYSSDMHAKVIGEVKEGYLPYG